MDKTSLFVAADFLEENGFTEAAKELRQHAGKTHLLLIRPCEKRGGKWETSVQIGMESDCVIVREGELITVPLIIPRDGRTLTISLLPEMD